MNGDFFATAACRGMDPNKFFPERGQSYAKETDAACDVCCAYESGECLTFAIQNPGGGGRFAKTSPKDRAALTRRIRANGGSIEITIKGRPVVIRGRENDSKRKTA